ncbi:MAG TPA: ABC transporter permease [Clostridiales bacterium]|nr:ABC transporter permease [Clostridiales bacterium]
MKKSNLAGWKDVFIFTLTQTLKSKAFLVTYAILLVLILISMPLVTILTNRGTEDPNAPSPIEKVYVENKTTLPDMDFSLLTNQEAFQNISFVALEEDYKAVEDRIDSEEQTSVLLTISEEDSAYSLAFVKAGSGPVKDRSLEQLGSATMEQFEAFRIQALGISDEQVTLLQAPVTTAVSLTDTEGNAIEKEDTSISFNEYWLMYGILFVVLMVNTMGSTQIATSIVTEKSTRVVEYLLISVKPLALMVGKILATLIAVLVQMVSMVVMVFISNRISAGLSEGNGTSLLSTYLPKNIFENMNLVNILFCFLLIILGFIFYATLAGLAGATVSKLEELNEGLTLFTFTNIIGAYIAIGALGTLIGSGTNTFVTFTLLFPLSSPFILPGAILIGKATIPIVAAAIVLQIIFILLLFKFVAAIYETLILHTGNTIKLKELMRISKLIQKGGKVNE